MFSCLFRNVVSRYRAGVRIRLTIVIDQRRQNFNRIGFDDKFVILGTDMLGDAASIFEFAEILLLQNRSRRS